MARCGGFESASRFGCGNELVAGFDDAHADHGPVEVAGVYALDGGTAFFFWDAGRLCNHPAQCAGCREHSNDLDAQVHGFKDAAALRRFQAAENDAAAKAYKENEERAFREMSGT